MSKLTDNREYAGFVSVGFTNTEDYYISDDRLELIRNNFSRLERDVYQCMLSYCLKNPDSIDERCKMRISDYTINVDMFSITMGGLSLSTELQERLKIVVIGFLLYIDALGHTVVSKSTNQENEKKDNLKQSIESDVGLRYDDGKLRYDLLPFDVLDNIVAVLTQGAQKYEPHNWEKGMSWSKCLASLLRHLSAFSKGVDIDPESGRPHIDHVVVNGIFLSAYQSRGIGTDDRFLKNNNKQFTKKDIGETGGIKRKNGERFFLG